MKLSSTAAIAVSLVIPVAAMQVVIVLGQQATIHNRAVLSNGAPYFDEEKDNQLGYANAALYFDENKDNQMGLKKMALPTSTKRRTTRWV
ncbi:hypothetical protein ACSQ76_07430 [Roseovarius sp. B08]|uniref:hypothetical protein n=1 Tax=Roseovarius sp. B08 TaxID=3449223 RepID=UPI003EDC247A